MIYVITGHYGSGKTEVALNLAFLKKVKSIVDLDIVNPYFRTKDAEIALQKANIRLIAPEFANTNLDLPTLPPDILSAFDTVGDSIFDVGGDEEGAIALGQYFNYFNKTDYEHYIVINTKRPDTSSVEKIIDYIKGIESYSRLKITGLISNTNLLSFTTPEMILDGYNIVKNVSKETGLKIIYTAAKKEFCEYINIDNELLPMDLYLSLPWQTN